MIDNSLVAVIYENEQPSAEIEEDDVEIEVPDFVSLGLPIVSLSKTGNVTTLEITDKNGKQTAKIYDGYNGHRGNGILNVITKPTKYVFPAGGKIPTGRMSISTIISESGANMVLVGDLISHDSNLYHIYYFSDGYAFIDYVVSIRGSAGLDGKDGADGYTPVKGKDYFTDAEIAEMVSSVVARLPVYDGSVTTV